MNDALKMFANILRSNSDSVTSTRKQVFMALYGKDPLSIHDLYEQLNGKVDRVSVYRTVDLFEKRGIANRIQIGWKYKIELSDVFVEHHHHVSCLGCGKVFAVQEDERIENLIAEIASRNHIHNPVHQLEIQGYCDECYVKNERG